MEGFQLPTSAILILSRGSGWHGNLILGKEGKEEGGDGGEGVIFKKNNLFKHTPSHSNIPFISSNASDLNFDFTVAFFFFCLSFLLRNFTQS